VILVLLWISAAITAIRRMPWRNVLSWLALLGAVALIAFGCAYMDTGWR
jgi:hypothetical protein